MLPERTFRGKVAKFKLYEEPLVWVEGDTDLVAFRPLAERYGFRLEEAGGRDECLKLAREMAAHDLGYVVVIDGEYETLHRSRSFHRRAVFLHRHSVENYLFEDEPVASTIRAYSGITSSDDVLDGEFSRLASELEDSLRELLIYDIAAILISDVDSPFPNHIDTVLEEPDSFEIDEGKVDDRIEAAAAEVPIEDYEEAELLLEGWEASGRRVADLINGHVVFGGISRLIARRVEAKARRYPRIPNRALLLMLANDTWFKCSGPDHRSLKRRIRRRVRELRREGEASDTV